MLVLQEQDRHQMQFYRLEDPILEGNPVLFIEAFMERDQE
jgi:hypothetical protein